MLSSSQRLCVPFCQSFRCIVTFGKRRAPGAKWSHNAYVINFLLYVLNRFEKDCTIFIIRFRPLEKLAFLWSTLLDKRLESSQIAFTFHFQRHQSLFDLDVAHLAYHFGEVVLYPGWSFEPGQVAKYLVARRGVAECSDTYYWLVSVYKLLSVQMGHERI